MREIWTDRCPLDRSWKEKTVHSKVRWTAVHKIWAWTWKWTWTVLKQWTMAVSFIEAKIV